MRVESHGSVVRESIRGGEIFRHAIARFGVSRGAVIAVAGGLGLPRLWGLSLDAALSAFTSACKDGTESAPAERMDAALFEARRGLAKRCDTLIERMTPDVSLVAVWIEDGHLYVLGSGEGRAYVYRPRESSVRLLPREETSAGILRAPPIRAHFALEPGDLVMAGSTSAFSTKAIGHATSVLHADANVQVSVLASLLTEPAGKAGVGAAVVVSRVL